MTGQLFHIWSDLLDGNLEKAAEQFYFADELPLETK